MVETIEAELVAFVERVRKLGFCVSRPNVRKSRIEKVRRK